MLTPTSSNRVCDFRLPCRCIAWRLACFALATLYRLASMPYRGNALAHRYRAAKWSIRQIATHDRDDEQLREPKCSIHRFRFVPCLLLALGYACRSKTLLATVISTARRQHATLDCLCNVLSRLRPPVHRSCIRPSSIRNTCNRL